jgi:hypothetical protein
MLTAKCGFQASFADVSERETPAEISAVKPPRNTAEIGAKTDETARKARFQEVVVLRKKGWGKVKILKKVYNARPGTSEKYLSAVAEYTSFLEQLEQDF